MSFCPSCGANNADDSAFCISCGTKLQNDTAPDQPMYTQPVQPQPDQPQPVQPQPDQQQPTYAQQTYAQPMYTQQTYAQPMYTRQTYAQPVQSQPVYAQPTYTAPQTGRVAGIPSKKCLAAGILSVVFSGLCLAIIFGPIAIVQGSKVIKKYGKQGFAIAAIVLGSIGLLISLANIIVVIGGSMGDIASMFNSFSGMGRYY